MTVTVGNTPAYAGKTVKLVDLSNSLQKHPRLRGEDSRSAFSVDSTPETPPLTRGRPDGKSVRSRCAGNTPAYAGKTAASACRFFASQKHPRLRGEDSSEGSQNRFQVETPPLTRGRPPRQGEDHHGLGNTPAYAGKTQQRDRARRRRSKHPRLRGEDVLFAIQKQRDLETPPLTRGRLWQGD